MLVNRESATGYLPVAHDDSGLCSEIPLGFIFGEWVRAAAAATALRLLTAYIWPTCDTRLVRDFVAAAAFDALRSGDVILIGADDVLGLVAPAVVAARFVGVRCVGYARDIHCLGSQMDAGGGVELYRFVKRFLKSHDQNPPVSSPAASRIARFAAT